MGHFFKMENWRDARGMQLAARVDRILLVGTMGFACSVPGPWVLNRWMGLPPAAAWIVALTGALLLCFMFGEILDFEEEPGGYGWAYRFALYGVLNGFSMGVAWLFLEVSGRSGGGQEFFTASLVATSAAIACNYGMRVFFRMHF